MRSNLLLGPAPPQGPDKCGIGVSGVEIGSLKIRNAPFGRSRTMLQFEVCRGIVI